ITSERDVAREYARVKLQSELVAQAARASETEQELPGLPERPPVRELDAWHPARLATVACSLALSVGLVVFAGSMYWSEGSALRGDGMALALEDFEKVNPRMVVTGPAVITPGAPLRYEVSLENLHGDALADQRVEASLRDIEDNVVWNESGPTSGDGKR